MQLTSRLSVLCCGASAVLAGLFLILGCGGVKSPGESGQEGHEHSGHVVPAHKPKSFPLAVQRLKELNEGLVRDPSGPQAPGPPDQKTLQIALDIANWLPEIAADSDLPEVPWNKVSFQSAVLVADYQALLSSRSANRESELASASKAILELERVLAAADPRWFGQIGPKGGEP